MSHHRRAADRLLAAASLAVALLAGALAVVIAIWLAGESSAAIGEVGLSRFLGDGSWNPTRDRFGLAPMAATSVVAAAGALVIALPLAVLVALFKLAYAPPLLARGLGLLLELLAAVPSVVIGFFGLTAVVPLLLRIAPPGASLLAGILVLALMVLPTLALLIEAAVGAIPRAEVVAAAALGLPRSAVLIGLALPRARAAIGAAALVALGRALGETMAVLMVCGNVVAWPSGLLLPVRTLTANIALEMPYAVGLHRGALFVSGLALLTATLLLLLGGRFIAGRAGRVTAATTGA